MQTPRYGFDIRLSDEDGAFLATCPSFPNLSAFGPTPDRALQEAQVVLDLYLEEFEAAGLTPPPPQTAEPA